MIDDLTDSSVLGEYESYCLFNSKKWLNMLTTSYGFPMKVIAGENGRVNLASMVTEKLGLKKMICLPFSDYVIPHFDSEKKFNEVIIKITESLDMPFILKFKPPPNIDISKLNFLFKESACCHTVNTQSNDLIHQNMHNSFRRGVKKAEKSKLSFRIRRDETALKTFYRMYHKLRIQKFRKLPQPYCWFEALFEIFIKPGNGFVIEVVFKSKVIASALILQHQDKLYYKYGASEEGFLNLRPNNLLFYRLLLYSEKCGFSELDLGLSGLHTSYKGLRRFKRHMGGVKEPIYTFSYFPSDYFKEMEKKVDKLTTHLTEEIVDQNLPLKKVSSYSEILYPFFV